MNQKLWRNLASFACVLCMIVCSKLASGESGGHFYAETLFDFGKVTLRPEDKAKLNQLIATLKGLRPQVILVVGHVDRFEGRSAAEKLKLSEMRAQAIKDYLVANGLDASHIYTEGKSDNFPTESYGKKITVGCKGSAMTKELIDCLQPDRRAEIEGVANP
ncbi:MAG: OmpA family protein [Proteobacteria bacterium]|nr:OmpA family protein [Pseudomonadota bacterium]